MPKSNIPKHKASFVTANPFKRIAAFLIDLFILQLIVISSFAAYFENVVPKDIHGFDAVYSYLSANSQVIQHFYYSLIAISLLMIMYFSYMEYMYSQTIGKMIFKLYVETTNGEEMSFMKCLVRNIYLIPVFPIFLLWIIDPIYLFYKGSRLSEELSKTRTMEEFIS